MTYKELPTQCKIHVNRQSFKFNTINMNRIKSSYIEYYCDDDCDEWLGWSYKSENGIIYGTDKCNDLYVLNMVKNYREQTMKYNHSNNINCVIGFSTVAFFAIMLFAMARHASLTGNLSPLYVYVGIWIGLIVLATISFYVMLCYILNRIWKVKIEN